MKEDVIEKISRTLADFDFGLSAEAVEITFISVDETRHEQHSVWLHGPVILSAPGLPNKWGNDDWERFIEDCIGSLVDETENIEVTICFRAAKKGYEQSGGILCKVLVGEDGLEGIEVMERAVTENRPGVSKTFISLNDVEGIDSSEDIVDIVCSTTNCERSDFVGLD